MLPSIPKSLIRLIMKGESITAEAPWAGTQLYRGESNRYCDKNYNRYIKNTSTLNKGVDAGANNRWEDIKGFL